MVQAKDLHHMFSVPIGVTVGVFGLLGNVLSGLVWIRILKRNRGGNKSTAIYFLVLAIADSGMLLFFLTTDSLPNSAKSLLATYSFCAFFSYMGFPFFFFFVVFSIWLIVAVSVNRSLMVLFPMKAKTLCSTTRAYASIMSILVCCFVINFPHFFNFRPQLKNGTYVINPTEYGGGSGALKYEFWVHCMFLVLVPWIFIACANTCIVLCLVKRSKEAQKQFSKSISNKRHSQDKQMTIMLLAITFTFLLLLAWQCVTQCFFMLEFGKGEGHFSEVDKSFAAAKIGVVINSSCNFLLYCLTGSAFRREVLALIGKRSAEIHSTTSTSPNTTKYTGDALESSVGKT